MSKPISPTGEKTARENTMQPSNPTDWTKTAALLLGPDDLPTCPKHGIRLATDYFEAEGESPEYELGECRLCKKHYTFVFT
jgi:hypothetical protein